MRTWDLMMLTGGARLGGEQGATHTEPEWMSITTGPPQEILDRLAELMTTDTATEYRMVANG